MVVGMYNDWLKGWRLVFYFAGWFFGVFSLAFWIILLGVHFGFNYGGKFWNARTEAVVYYYGLVFSIWFILGMTIFFILQI
jgi:hypothetical protein